jgi:Fe-S oxidoreductase
VAQSSFMEASRPAAQLPQEWLRGILPERSGPAHTTLRLLPHCTERTNAPDSSRTWVEVFQRCGVALQPVSTGCCGMAGTYGHEARNRENSHALFAASWAPALDTAKAATEAVATGYSCRSQAHRVAGARLRHPLSALLDCIRAPAPRSPGVQD